MRHDEPQAAPVADEDEISNAERRARELLRQFGFGQPSEQQVRLLVAALRQARAEAIEECARVSNERGGCGDSDCDCARFIRALASPAPSPRRRPTMADREQLLALAERCEAATEGSVQLDIAILSVVGWGTGVRLTRSLDDALKLVPEGWNRRLSEDDSGRWWAELRHGYETSYGAVEMSSRVATPALALCAAALRALAAQAERG